MGFIWDYKTKRNLHEKVKSKLFQMYDFLAPVSNFLIQADPEKWNSYLDLLGCTRILKTKTGWDYEDEKTPRSESKTKKKNYVWRSLNTPGYVHVNNPFWSASFDNSEHVIRIPKEIAEKIMVIGFP